MFFRTRLLKGAMALSVAVGLGAALPAPASAQSSSERALALAQFAKKKGVKKSFDKAFKGVDKAAKFARSLNDKDSRLNASQLASGLDALGKLSEHAGYLGAAVDLALLFVPEAPDPVLLALDTLQDSVNDLHRDVLEGFAALENSNNRNFLDQEVKGAAREITGDYTVYLAYMESLDLMHGQGDVIYSDEVQEISGSDLYAATDTLAELCVGTDFFGGNNIFDAHLKVSNGDINQVVRIGHYILTKITQAQTAHGAKVLYGAKKELTAEATKTALDVMNARHEAHFDTCQRALEDTFGTFTSGEVIEGYARAFIKDFPGRKLDAKSVGQALRTQFPMWEWAVVTYPHKKDVNPVRKDKRRENWDGFDYVKTIANDTQVVIAGYFKPTDAGRKEMSGCASSLNAFNASLHANWLKTGQSIGRPREVLKRKCKDAGTSVPLVWASNRRDASVWTSDPLSVYSTRSSDMDTYAKQTVKYLIVGTDNKSCSGIAPRWSRLAGVGGSGARADFVTTDNRKSEYAHNKRNPDTNCFRTRRDPYASAYGIDPVGRKLAAVLDNSHFDAPSGRFGTNYALLNDGTYVRYKTNGDYDTLYETGQTVDAFPGLTVEQSKRIVAATPLTTNDRVYLFFEGGTYVRFNPETNKVDLTERRIADNWEGVRNDIVAAGEFVKSSGAVYFFYEDGTYGRYDVKQKRVTLERKTADIWK